MARFFTSDQHYGHKNICKYENRPFATVADMDRALIAAWNEVVAPQDEVVHLGDLSFHGKERTREIWNELHGRKTLLPGNHDRSDTWLRDCGIQLVEDEWVMLGGKYRCRLMHDPASVKLGYNYALHGHLHGKKKQCFAELPFVVHVGCDAWDYRPVSEEKILELIGQ